MLTDNHIHSTISTDASNTMTEMALASYDKGVRYLCFTDHCDLDCFRTGQKDPNCFDMKDDMLRQFEIAKSAVPDDMRLFLGVELGEGNHDPKRMAQVASTPELDFVLGTLHNLLGETDFYVMNYTSREYCKQVLDRYADELLELAGIDDFDVMAHVGYAVRYIRREGFKDISFDMNTHGEQIDALFKKLISRGKGIEINCSGLRNEFLRETMPGLEVLRHYKELGGEIITVGSDAHKVRDAAFGLREGFDILRELGYNYVTIFRKRKPEFIKI